MRCPPSTVYAVLKRKKLISKEYRKKRAKKHIKRYRRQVPGFLQMDFKYVPFLLAERQYYQLSAVDHCSSWRLIRSYENKSEEQVMEFLQELRRECPFVIAEIQTDNDAAFTDKYNAGMGLEPTGTHPLDQWCQKYGIRHKLIPIGEKELNGKVENTHKYDDEEFYSQHRFTSFPDLAARTYTHNYEWNHRRATKTLGWKTPQQVVDGYLYTFRLIELWFDSLQKEITDQGLDTWIGLGIELPSPIKKIKKPDPLDRYLAWMAWDAAQYHKYSLMLVSGMSLSYAGARPTSTWPTINARKRNDKINLRRK
jgi:transposase InsO family protein